MRICSYLKLSLVLFLCLLVNKVSLANDGVLVVTEPLQFSPQTQRIEAVGTAQALRAVVLYPAVADRVVEIAIIPGQQVERDDVLVRLDSRRQQIAVDRARIQLADAERTVDRLTRSREQQAIPQSELDDAVTARDLLRVELSEAEANLEDRIVRAPFAGIVGITDVEVGDRINEQTAITTLDYRGQMYINFRAPESALDLLGNNATLVVSPWQQQGDPLQAQVVEVDSRLDSTNRTIRIRALMENPNDRYRPGTSFRVRLQTSGDSYASIPEAALMWGPTSPYIWRVQGGTAERVDVTIKQRVQGRVLVEGPLQPEQIIITEGVQSVREGQTVRQHEPDQQEAR